MTSKNLVSPQHGAQLLLAIVGFLFALGGQFAFYLAPEGSTRGVLLGAGLSLVGAVSLVVSLLGRPPAWAVRLSLTTRAVLVVAAVLFAGLASVTEVLFMQYGRTNYLPVLLLWLAGAVLYACAFIEPGLTWPRVRAWLYAHRHVLLTVGLIMLLGASVRLFRLGLIPRVIDGDEGQVGAAALRTALADLANPFALWANFGGLYLQAIALALNIFGSTPFALRLMPALAGSLSIGATYLLARAVAGPRAGLLAACLLAVSHAHLHFSRIVSVAYIIETLFIPLELYFFYTGLRTRQAWRAALGGLVLGTHFSIYVSAQIITALLVVYLLIALVVARPLLRGAGRTLLTFWLGALITGVPQAVYSFLRPEEFLARLNTDGTFQSGWLAQEIASRGQSAAQILAGRVGHAFLTLNHIPAMDFYGARIPLLDLLTGMLFLLGLVYSLWRTRDSGFLLLNGYFWSLLLAIGLFSIPPTADSYRMLVALPAAIILAAVALDRSFALLLVDGPERRGLRLAVTSVLLAAILLLNWRAYFVDFAARCRYGGDRATRFASYLGNYLKAVDAETVVYLLSDDELTYGTHGSVDFLSGGNPVTNWNEPVQLLSVNANTVVLAGPSRHAELREWARLQPTGEMTHITDCDQPMLLVYEASPEFRSN